MPLFLTHSHILRHCAPSSSLSQTTFPLSFLLPESLPLMHGAASELGSFHVTTATGNKSAEFTLGTRSMAAILQHSWATTMGWRLLGKAPFELTHHISQVHGRTHCDSRGSSFSELLTAPLCFCATGLDVFKTQWVHLTGQAQCEKSSPKCFESRSRMKMNKKEWERKNGHCLVSKNVNAGQV